MRNQKIEGLVAAGLTAGLVCSCGSNKARESEGDSIGTLTNSATATETADGDGDGSGGTVGGTGEDAGDDLLETKFDLGLQPDVVLEEPEGCTKVDFLFVIDNSGSMGDDQVNLVNNFPAFITGIQATLDNVDSFHVGVTTSDDYSFNGGVGCNTLGSLVNQTGGVQASGMNCAPYASGLNFMTEADDLAAKFACAAQVGASGSSAERPMNAMEIAVRGDLGGPGQCNEDFMRDDALLVIVIITDEWDGPNDPEIPGSTGTAQTWYDTVVAAKGGIPENAVGLALINYAGGPCPYTPGSFDDGIHIYDWTQLFGVNGFVGGVCEPDYGPVFMEATTIIEGACANFKPPG